jgi:tetratricopeptide (TPR) repeat protein
LLFLQGSSALELGRRDARPLLAKALSFVPLAPDYRARLAYADYAIGAGFKSHSKGAGLAVPSTLTYVVADTLKAEQAGMLEGFAHGQLARMLDPREPWERRAVFSDTILARRHRRMAIERFEHATRDVPGSSDSNAILPNAPGRRAALFELASHLERLGERPRAREVLRRLIRQDSSQAMALNYLGYLLVENAPVDSAALAEAGDLLDRAVNIEPENGAYLDSKGWWFYRRGDLDSARVLLDRAAHAIPSDPSILLHQVDVFQALGRPADACAAWREIVRRDPRRQAPAECGR